MVAKQNLIKRCFVISPIGEEDTPVREHANLVFEEIIEPIMRGEGYQAYRSDHENFPDDITDRVIRAIWDADMVVALLTGGNANVYYELAVSHTLKKPTIQMIKKGDHLYFDVGHQNTIKFNPEDVRSVSQAQGRLREQVRRLEQNPDAISNPVRRVLDPPFPTPNLGINITAEDKNKFYRPMMEAMTDIITWYRGRFAKQKTMFAHFHEKLLSDITRTKKRQLTFPSSDHAFHWKDLIALVNEGEEVRLVSNNDLDYWNEAMTQRDSEAAEYSDVLARFPGPKTRILILDEEALFNDDMMACAEKVIQSMLFQGFTIAVLPRKKIHEPDAPKTARWRDFGLIGNNAVSFFRRTIGEDISREFIVSFDETDMRKALEDWTSHKRHACWNSGPPEHRNEIDFTAWLRQWRESQK
jgi:hypothetical protein